MKSTSIMEVLRGRYLLPLNCLISKQGRVADGWVQKRNSVVMTDDAAYSSKWKDD